MKLSHDSPFPSSPKYFLYRRRLMLLMVDESLYVSLAMSAGGTLTLMSRHTRYSSSDILVLSNSFCLKPGYASFTISSSSTQSLWVRRDVVEDEPEVLSLTICLIFITTDDVSKDCLNSSMGTSLFTTFSGPSPSLGILLMSNVFLGVRLLFTYNITMTRATTTMQAAIRT